MPATRADPDGQGRAPVTLAAQRPVDVVFEPVAEAAIADILGYPMDLLIVRQQLVFARRGADVPGEFGIIEQRRVAAPAERIAMANRTRAEEQPAFAQVAHNERVGFFE